MKATRVTTLQIEKRVKFRLADGSIVEPSRSVKETLISAPRGQWHVAFDREALGYQAEKKPANKRKLARKDSISSVFRCMQTSTALDKFEIPVNLTAEIKADNDEMFFAMDEDLENLPPNGSNGLVDDFDEVDRTEDFERQTEDEMIMSNGTNEYCGSLPVDID